ncbi:Hypothetical_protein [Hexamita inflata]|uniref:Hypothetical_protein n=1 Tax=Hexamita inflata TaxID=28002 RepID=A0AA86PH69_9EUKA|nr:Hypothetical protein HINF_LOCUS26959 [Hexamita inflata]
MSTTIISGGLIGITEDSKIIVIQSCINDSYFYSNATSGYSLTAAAIAALFDTNLWFQNSQIINIQILSTSTQNYSISGGFVSAFSKSQISFSICYILSSNIETQSNVKIGISGAYVGCSQLQNNITIQSAQTLNTFITAHACYPRSSGVIGQAFNTTITINNVEVNKCVIHAKDLLYSSNSINSATDGLAAGVIGFIQSCQLFINKQVVQDSQINSSCRINSSASSIISQIYISDKVLRDITVLNCTVYSNSSEQLSFSAGIVGNQNGIMSQQSVLFSIYVLNTNISALSSNSYNINQFASTICALSYYSNEMLDSVKIDSVKIMSSIQSNNGQTGVTCVGGLYGYSDNSRAQIKNILINNCIFSSINLYRIYLGGAIGESNQSYIEIQDFIITNTNLSVDAQIDGVVSGIMGFYVNSTVYLYSVTAKNIILNTVSKYAYAGAFFAAAQSSSSQNTITIKNSVIESIQIWHSENQVNVNLIFILQTPFISNITISIIDTESRGFSYINGVQTQNCQQIVRQINDAYIIQKNGC